MFYWRIFMFFILIFFFLCYCIIYYDFVLNIDIVLWWKFNTKHTLYIIGLIDRILIGDIFVDGFNWFVVGVVIGVLRGWKIGGTGIGYLYIWHIRWKKCLSLRLIKWICESPNFFWVNLLIYNICIWKRVYNKIFIHITWTHVGLQYADEN